MRRPPPTLPIEVCERILDHFERGMFRRGVEGQTLYSCCLVCRAWVPRSRFHLYSTVELVTGKLTEFVRGISLQPFNGHLVRELWLSSSPRFRHVDYKLSLVPLQLPQLLPNLRHIEFFFLHRTDLHPRFFVYLSRFRSVRSLSLASMHHTTITQLARYVTAFPGLSECRMSLSGDHVRGLSFPGTRLPTKRIAISKLTLILSPDLHQVAGPILDIFSPSSVHELDMELDINQSDREGVRQPIASFVERCAGSLRMLSLQYNGWEHLDFSHNTSLVSLSLKMERYFVSLEQRLVNPVHPSTLSRILSTICSKCMKELHLRITISTSSEDTISPSGWDELDSTLALPTFSQIERIALSVMAYSWTHDSGPHLISVSERTMRHLLPRLATRAVADLSLPWYQLTHARDYKISSPDDPAALGLQTFREISELPLPDNKDF